VLACMGCGTQEERKEEYVVVRTRWAIDCLRPVRFARQLARF